jgi:hypothetical protein
MRNTRIVQLLPLDRFTVRLSPSRALFGHARSFIDTPYLNGGMGEDAEEVLQ